MKLGDLVQVKGGLYGWGSPGIVIKIERENSRSGDPCVTIHIMGFTGEIHPWCDFQLEVISEGW